MSDEIKKYNMSFSERLVYKSLREELMKYEKIIRVNPKIINDVNLHYSEETILCGYKKEFGYFMIYCERGHVSQLFKSNEKDEMIAEWIMKKLHSYGFDYELDNRKKFQNDWHYCHYYDKLDKKEVRAIIESTGLVKDYVVENNSWKYDLNYDGRKYAFEHILQLLLNLNIDEKIINIIIKKYSNYMNNWEFDRKNMEFIIK